MQTTPFPAGSRARVTPCATISESQRTGAPAANAARAAATNPGANRNAAAASTCPQAWIIRTATSASASEKRDRSASSRMIANDRR